jgi:hypothetical protein
MTTDQLIRALDRGFITSTEFVSHAQRLAGGSAADAAELLDRLGSLSSHSNEWVRSGAADAIQGVQEAARRRAEQIKDIEVVRRTSPLQPGTRVALGGGYSAAFGPPSWLGGRDQYTATFLGFAQYRPDIMPVAHVEFDDEVALPRVRGRYGLLRLLYVANWAATETVVVHILESLPEDIGPFCGMPPDPLPSEVETHATYRVITEDRDGS